MRLRIQLVAVTGLVLMSLLSVNCAGEPGLNERLEPIVDDYRFSIAQWEARTILGEIGQCNPDHSGDDDQEIKQVIDYFAYYQQIREIEAEIQAINSGEKPGDTAVLEAQLDQLQEKRTQLQGAVESVLEEQIGETLSDLGIFYPEGEDGRSEVNFPPVNFKLDKPPYLLVISPRQKIESTKEVLLISSINLEEIEKIEGETDGIGVSSLVVELGGVATYPSFVTNEARLRFVLDTTAHEWVHQYLFFRPLGFQYALDVTGISPDYDIATMNETVASIVSEEIAALVCQRYYADYCEAELTPTPDTGFDFNGEMREIRRAVDQYLAQGEVELAETFMEERRQYLATNGYYLRKLNQAYFAFYGTYADSPASISPIGAEMKELRQQAASLKEFLELAARITSRSDLQASINSPAGELND